MKIAVASEREMVTKHLGHCESFIIYETENNQIITSNSIPNPRHRPGFLPKFLNELGVNVIISGGIGEGAINIFNEKGIKVIVGADGPATSNVKLYLQNHSPSN
ncbi:MULTISPECIES: NifB/NifX family molybdenum-iron cluster-binding protein [Mesobacillus]|uniref:Fe-Mo cluster-binding NifX family protein n=1 Tax=Mesobacillus stamsii TaxID=225347 RepID=A0ABU0FWL3_9BACI|nr:MULTISPECIES: NifB/NifX family molybdenum-iron cluster-binding protein [Mesobacillus]MDQ0414299.1 putative Fe-Mo cluster-binding NifX family protein [Mesobacillus stamsii]